MTRLREWVSRLPYLRRDEFAIPGVESRWESFLRRLRSVSRLDWTITVGSLAVLAGAVVLLVPLPAVEDWNGRIEVGAAALTGLIVGLLLLAAQVRVQADRDAREAASKAADDRREVRLTLSTKGDLLRADLSELDLTEITLKHRKLTGAEFDRATIASAQFLGSDLQDASFLSASARWARFEDADLRGADMRWASLEHALFASTDLRGACLNEARLVQAYFRRADLRGAFMHQADCFHGNFEGAKLGGMYAVKARFSDASFWGADFGDAQLDECDFSGADLGGANLEHADLWGCDFTGARETKDTKWPAGFKERWGEHLGVSDRLVNHDSVCPLIWQALIVHTGRRVDYDLLEPTPHRARRSEYGSATTSKPIQLRIPGFRNLANDEEYARFGRRLEGIRHRQDLSLEDVAKVARVKPARVEEWETTGRITLGELGGFVLATGARPGRIFGGFSEG